jgi:uncharacterized protein (DUF2267 family)
MEDPEEEFVFEEVPLEKFQLAPDEDEGEETFEALKTAVQLPPKVPTLPVHKPQPSVSTKPVVVEDFIRNYLKKMKMERTLDTFQVSSSLHTLLS